MADRKLVVTVIGDDRSFINAMNRSAAAANKFGRSVEKNVTRPGVSSAASMQPLLDSVRSLQDRADALQPRLNNLDDGLRNAGRGAGILGDGLGATAARAGLIGIAVTAAYQASRKLSAALEQTGAEAFTTEGRFRNFGAALLSGDIIGGFQALSRQPKTFEDLGISIVEATNNLEEFEFAAENLGGQAGRLAQEVVNLVASIEAAENAQNALADATARLGTVFVTTTGQAVTFKGAVDDLGGMRGPGAVDAINDALKAAGGATSGRIARALGPTAKNKAAQTIAAATQDLAELLRLQVVERDRLAKAVENSRGNVKQREALNQQYAEAQAAVIGTQRQIDSNADAAARAAQAAKEAARREAEAAREEAREIARAAAERANAIKQAKQFRALGLSETGDEIVPGVKNLAKRIQGALRRIDSGEIDVSTKMVDRLKLAQKLIRKEGGKLTAETRQVINDLIRTVTKGTEDLAKSGPLTKTVGLNAQKVLEGLGLTPEQEREARARLSGFNSAGRALAGNNRPTGNFRTPGGVTETTVNVNLDGEQVGKAVTKTQQKTSRRNPKQKRGPRSGV